MKRGIVCLTAALVLILGACATNPATGQTKPNGLAGDSVKFIGGIIPFTGVPRTFGDYFNQVTPENDGKWQSVQGAGRGQFYWSNLDVAYSYAKSHNLPFKEHCLVWGSQYPAWVTSLSVADQKEAVLSWIKAYAARYGEGTWAVDVVNEPIKTVCPFKEALGGAGETGYDWIVWSFETARTYLPKAKLLINEYGTENDPAARAEYIKIIKLLQSKGLIDGIGLQAHFFNLDYMTAVQMKECLDDYATLGLPIYISELDIRGTNGTATEEAQLAAYQTLFPVMWKHPAVRGITFWGYIEGRTWKAGTGLVTSGGTERAALRWLSTYVAANPER
jgi:endo-1,4-beta-xylanase